MSDYILDTSRQRELPNCTYLKALLMLLVVVYHSIVFWTGTWFTEHPIYVSSFLAGIALWLNTFHIYGFTLVSGYLYAAK